LQRSGGARPLGARHFHYFHQLGRTADRTWMLDGQVPWMRRLATELDNVRAALTWSRQYGDETERRQHVRLIADSAPPFHGVGLLTEFANWIRGATQLLPPVVLAPSIVDQAGQATVDAVRSLLPDFVLVGTPAVPPARQPPEVVFLQGVLIILTGEPQLHLGHLDRAERCFRLGQILHEQIASEMSPRFRAAILFVLGNVAGM